MLGRVIWRSLVVVVAFCLATAIAMIVLFALGTAMEGDSALQAMMAEDPELLELMTEHPAYKDSPFNREMVVIGSAIIMFFLFVPAAMAVPAFAGAVAGEVLHIRSWIYYVLVGGAVFAAIPILVPEAAGMLILSESAYVAIFATAGFAGGFIYWLLAGRGA